MSDGNYRLKERQPRAGRVGGIRLGLGALLETPCRVPLASAPRQKAVDVMLVAAFCKPRTVLGGYCCHGPPVNKYQAIIMQIGYDEDKTLNNPTIHS